MVGDLRDARLAPAGRDVARVEEKRAGGVILPRAVARDLRDLNGLVPQRRVTHRWHPAAAHEAELPLLEYDAAQAFGKGARLGAYHPDLRDRELAGQRVAPRIDIDRTPEDAQCGLPLGRTRRGRHTPRPASG